LALAEIPAWVGFLSNPAGASMPLFARSIADGARARGIAVVTEERRTPDDGEIARIARGARRIGSRSRTRTRRLE
jgi:hypothetical protein